jgi:hypothetical protein
MEFAEKSADPNPYRRERRRQEKSGDAVELGLVQCVFTMGAWAPLATE